MVLGSSPNSQEMTKPVFLQTIAALLCLLHATHPGAGVGVAHAPGLTGDTVSPRVAKHQNRLKRS